MGNYYEILGVPTTTSQEEIRTRYRYLAQAFHPDRFPSPETKRQAEDDMKRVNEAYTVLSNPDQHRRYDVNVVNKEPYTSRNSEYKSYYRSGYESDYAEKTSKEKDQKSKPSEEEQRNEKVKESTSRQFCYSCKQYVPVKELVFCQNIGVIAFRFTKINEGYFCADCVEDLF